MKQQKALYEDVVVGDDPQKQEKKSPEKTSESEDSLTHPNLKIPKKVTHKSPKEAYIEGIKDAMKLKGNAGEKVASSKEGTKEGIKEQAKEEAKVEEVVRKKINTITERNDSVLFEAKAFFPFDLFPDKLIIDTTKLSIISKSFFMTEQVTTVNLKDITDVSVETSLFLGNLNVTYLPRTPTPSAVHPSHCKISLLRRSQALRAHNILRGLIIANEEKVDIFKIPLDKLTSTLERFGDSKAPL